MKQKSVLFVFAFLLICCAGWALASVRQHRKWGKPGVKVSVGPLALSDGKFVITNIVELPVSLKGYESQSEAMASVEINGLPPDTTFGRVHYRAADGFDTILTAVLMGSDRTSLHPPRYCIEGQGCSIQKTEQIPIAIERPFHYEMPVSKVSISKQVEHNGQKSAVQGIYLYWYVSESSLRTEYSSGIRTMLDSLLRNKAMDRWAYISCFSLFRPGEEEKTFTQMKQFLASSVPEFQLSSIHEGIKTHSATSNEVP